MGYNGNIATGHVPICGAIFAANIGTKKECFRRRLFGLPLVMSDFVLQVRKGMILFLFEFERRQLYGVFRAASDGEIDIFPNAYKSSGRQFPSQVRFTPMWDCLPLNENEFQDAIRDNYFTGKKFNFGLSEEQVRNLLKLFHAKKIPKNQPEREMVRYGDKPAERDRRSDDDRKILVRDRTIKLQKDNGDRFLTNHRTQNDDFGDRGTRQITLGNQADRGLRTMAESGFEELRGKTNEDRYFRMDKIKVKHEIEDGYRHIFTESYGKSFGRIGDDDKFGITKKRKDYMDDDRLEDEYNTISNGYPSIGNQTVNDGMYFGYEIEERTLDENLLKPSFVERSVFKPRSSYFTPGPSSSPPVIPASNDMSRSLAYHLQNEPPLRYFDAPETRNLVEGNRVLKTDVIEGSNSGSLGVKSGENVIKGHGFSSIMTLFSEYDSSRSSGEGRSKYFSESSKQIFCQGKYSEKRVSVFSRLTSAPERVGSEQVDVDASVDNVMKMLEEVVRKPIKRGGKRLSVYKENDDIVDHADENVIEEDTDDASEDGSMIHETRMVDFKRRKKASVDTKLKKNEVEVNSLTGMPYKRRRLVRPVFDRIENPQTNADENIPPLTDESSPVDGCEEEIEKEVDGCEEVGGNGNDQEEHAMAQAKDDQKMCGWIEY